MTYPLVGDLAADGIPVAAGCRVLGFSKQAYYAWKARPVPPADLQRAHLINTAWDVHRDDPAARPLSLRIDQDGIRPTAEGLPPDQPRSWETRPSSHTATFDGGTLRP